MSQRLISWKICYFKHISKALSGENDGPIKVAVSSLHYCITSITLVVSNHKTYFWGRRNYLSRLNPMEAFFFHILGWYKKGILQLCLCRIFLGHLIFYHVILISCSPHLDYFIILLPSLSCFSLSFIRYPSMTILNNQKYYFHHINFPYEISFHSAWSRNIKIF